jgi:hypothetical protein
MLSFLLCWGSWTKEQLGMHMAESFLHVWHLDAYLDWWGFGKTMWLEGRLEMEHVPIFA